MYFLLVCLEIIGFLFCFVCFTECNSAFNTVNFLFFLIPRASEKKSRVSVPVYVIAELAY